MDDIEFPDGIYFSVIKLHVATPTETRICTIRTKAENEIQFQYQRFVQRSTDDSL